MDLLPIIIFGTIIFIIKRAKRKNTLSRRASLAAAGVGGTASIAFLQQLELEQQLNQDMIDQMQQMDLQQMQDFALQNQLIDQMNLQQMMDQSMDPFQNVGLDPIIDHYYHGHDQGFDHSFNDHHQF